MNVAQLYANVNQKTSFSRPNEIYAALEEAGFKVYAAILKEFSGFFLKFDTTTITLTPGQSVYPMPPDLGNLVSLAERQTASGRWHTIEPTGLQDALNDAQVNTNWDGNSYGGPRFRFYGPYLPEITGPTQTQQINIEPAVDAVRFCEIAYTAKWLPITNANSLNTLPSEGTYCQQSFAIAEIHRGNNDSLSAEYEAKGRAQLTDFLTWIRNRQTVKWPTIKSYLED